MCLEYVRKKRQFFKKRKFAYKVLKRTPNNKLLTCVAEMPVRANTEVWQGAYKRIPAHVERYTAYHKAIHNKKVSVFLTLKDARIWTASSSWQIWLVEIKYDELLIGKQSVYGEHLQGALVDEFRLAKQIK